ncbi:MAG: GNAT family N-acetyltransferase [Leuconostoc suionicum]|uniref:GNAT family N-acetyltransferase n=1 Tax=Leuconostoc suionicum TaxID=1511761 RepID=UPI003F343F47
MTFDMSQPIAFSLEEASLVRAAEWQQLIQELMAETDTFLIASMRDGDEIPVKNDAPAITLLLIAEQGEQSLPVGIGSIENEEIGVAILKQFHGAGLGQDLMRALLDWAKFNGLSKVWLDVQIDNDIAVHIYQKYGFLSIGEKEHFTLPNGRDTELQRMILEL